MYIPLHRQNNRTSNNIKHINSMKALVELKDLKAGNIYKKVTENDTLVYVQVLSEGSKAICNYFYIALNDKNEVIVSEIKKGYYLSIAQGAFTPCTQKEFKAALKMIKNSLTF
uniref:Uncharacterized protein n=1 Tax=Siphoviridae sp. ctRNB7 TaxID=2825502 RepID=A0A8S5PUN9_9CAUD|nr:MAG TPA: hypothetical protein [Siphoviridae sp. ctRNB7]